MRKNIKNVIEAFINNQSTAGATCSTNGNHIYSYNMIIAERTPDGIKVADESNSPSRTTSAQIRAVNHYLTEMKVLFESVKNWPHRSGY